MKATYKKLKPKFITYGNEKSFSNDNFKGSIVTDSVQ